METWFRGVRTGAVALALGALVAGCYGDGPGILNVFFNMNSDGSCSSLTVDIDLDDADAAVALDGEAIDCALSVLLDNAGCNVDFDIVGGGDVLRVTITGCTVPAVAELFQCGFTDGSLADIADEVSAQCVCASGDCDTTPPICAAENGGSEACEDCDNGSDDDGNGLVDCDDPICEHAEACELGTTTTTTTTSSTTSTTLGDATLCDVIFRLDDEVAAGSVQWSVDYDDPPVAFLGAGDGVECESLVDGALSAFNDVESGTVLESGIISLDGVEGPTDLAVCKVRTDSMVDAGDFPISDVEAAEPDLDLIDPAPSLSARVENCTGSSTTTSTVPDTTTTTLPPDTTTTTSTTSTTEGGGETVGVQFRLDSAGAPLGALQFTADYSDAPGSFDGSGASVACSNQVGGALFAPNDNETAETLTIGIIALSPFSAPLDVTLCAFTGTSPVAGDFPVTIDDATDSDGVGVDASISVSIVAAP